MHSSQIAHCAQIFCAPLMWPFNVSRSLTRRAACPAAGSAIPAASTGNSEGQQCTTRSGSTAKELAKCMLKYYRISDCSALSTQRSIPMQERHEQPAAGAAAPVSRRDSPAAEALSGSPDSVRSSPHAAFLKPCSYCLVVQLYRPQALKTRVWNDRYSQTWLQ